ncbi:MAG: hypothetical protein PWR02_678 [Synergistales bacterium]|jgi:hypothetical protein|nr:hypothetical protein [Synergistales bacterium]
MKDVFPFVLMRGGTSKAVFFKKEEMPSDSNVWEDFLTDVMGSPDPTQIDGLGGANSLTSKVAIISKSDRKGFDVDYLFAQVDVFKKRVAWDSNCGNISSAVGPFSLYENLVTGPEQGTAYVNIFNVNTGKRILAEVEVKDGKPVTRGQFSIPGVPGTASPIWLSFYDPEGSVYGKFLPANKIITTLSTSRGPIDINIVDAGTPLVMVMCKDVGLSGTELPNDFDLETLKFLEEIRQRAASLCTTGEDKLYPECSAAIPKIAIIAPKNPYKTLSGENLSAKEMDLSVRMLSMQKPHNALAITGAISIASSSVLENSFVRQIIGNFKSTIKIGHPGGIMEVEIAAKAEGGVKFVKVLRTARKIAKGVVYTKEVY